MAESLYRNKTSLETIFRILDKDNSGQISLDEFGEACHLLHKHLPEHDTEEDLLEMCKMMDINKDGLVDLNEFLEAFRLCDQARRGTRGRALIIGESLSLEKSVPTPGAVTPLNSGAEGNSLTVLGLSVPVEKNNVGNGVVVTTSEVDPQEIMSAQREDDGSEDDDDEEDEVKATNEIKVDGEGTKPGVDQKTGQDRFKKSSKSKAEEEDDGEEVCLTKKKNGNCNISINRPS